MFLVNSRRGLVTAASRCSGGKPHHTTKRAFSRSYGTILPSSFTRVLSSALEYSSQRPVLVCGTVSRNLKLRGFSWKPGISHFPAQNGPVVSALSVARPDLPKRAAYHLAPGQPSPGRPSLLRLPIAVTRSTGILTCFPSATAIALALGADSPCPD